MKNKTDFANRLPRPVETIEKTQMFRENWNPITSNLYRIKFCYKKFYTKISSYLVLKFIRVYKYTLPHSIYIFYKLIKIYLVTKKKTTLDNTKSNQETRKEKLNKFKHKLVMRKKNKPKRPHTYTDANNRNTKQHPLYKQYGYNLHEIQ